MFRIGLKLELPIVDIVFSDPSREIHSSLRVFLPHVDLCTALFQATEICFSHFRIDRSQVGDFVLAIDFFDEGIRDMGTKDIYLLTTKGFRDLVEIGRAYRENNIYDLQIDNQSPIIERSKRHEIMERIDFRGAELHSLDESELENFSKKIKGLSQPGVAICFLHSWVNPEHENKAKHFLLSAGIEGFFCTSSETSSLPGELERFYSTIINVHLEKKHATAFNQLKKAFSGEKTSIHFLSGAGGTTSFQKAQEFPLKLSNATSASGHIAALHSCTMKNITDAVILNMDLYKTEACLIKDREIDLADLENYCGYPVYHKHFNSCPIELNGQSVVSVDSSGNLRVHLPKQDMDTEFCFGLPEKAPNIVEANIACGRFLEGFPVAGQCLDSKMISLSRNKISLHVAQALGVSIEAAAEGILDVANSELFRFISVYAASRGIDLRCFSLFAFGALAGLHSGKIAHDLGIGRVIIPQNPSVFSAYGTLLSNITLDYYQPIRGMTDEIDLGVLNSTFGVMEESAIKDCRKENIPRKAVALLHHCFFKYKGQSNCESIPISKTPVNENDFKKIQKLFHERHRTKYGYAFEDAAIELTRLHVQAFWPREKPSMEELFGPGKSSVQNPIPEETRIFSGGEYHRVPVLARASIPPESYLEGPLLIQEFDTFTFIGPDQRVTRDFFNNLEVFER